MKKVIEEAAEKQIRWGVALLITIALHTGLIAAVLSILIHPALAVAIGVVTTFISLKVPKLPFDYLATGIFLVLPRAPFRRMARIKGG